jgi:putative addiction module component (TIGR02574 family)
VPEMASLPSSSDLARLSVSERLDLMDDIWESLGSNREATPISEWHVTEIQRRLAALAVDGNRGRSVDDVFAELKRRL